jgi:hypothetical protein
MTTEHVPGTYAEPQGEPPRCLACGGADWREFSWLGSLYDRVLWMERHVASRAAQPRAELVAMPSRRRPRPVPE